MRRLADTPASRRTTRRVARGLSIVELMVGIAVGLFIVAGATFVAVNQIGDNRRLSLETQVQQDLRAAADLIARDLRRAGYWGNSQAGVWYEGGPNAANNPYTVVSPDTSGTTAHAVGFRYAHPTDPEDDTVDDVRETFGFKVEDYTVKSYIGGSWQALTDPNVLKVTRFDVQLQQETSVQACFKECTGGGTACWPREAVRRFVVEITGEAVSDPAVKRSVATSVRLRNDTIAGACPT
jgi:prepilin peptidase dependent protein B